VINTRHANTVLVVGQDGSLLIDDQFAPLTTKIVAATRKLGTKQRHGSSPIARNCSRGETCWSPFATA
jgi:hypothetical protein